MSVSKKTGLYLTGTTAGIVERVMKEFGYTKISNTINYIITEYDKMITQPKQEEKVVEEKPHNVNDWFVLEEE